MNTATFTVLTYNVHAFVGADGIYDRGRVHEVLREIDADVVALQEVAYPNVADPETALREELELDGRYHCVTGPTLARRSAPYGNVLLVRGEIEATRRIDLSVAKREPRGAIIVEARVCGREICIAASHFGLSSRERSFQAQRLIEAFDSLRAPLEIVAGDFNLWQATSSALRRLNRRFGRAPRRKTYPARRPMLALDRIWVNPVAVLREIRVQDSPLARAASDHRPLIAEIDGRALADANRSGLDRPA